MISTTNQALIMAMFILAICSPVALSRAIAADSPMTTRYEQWMKQFNRVYETMSEEKDRRFEIFKKNAEYVDSVNSAGDRKYTLGLNQFADMTKEEVAAFSMGFKNTPPAHNSTGFRYADVMDVPDAIDWRSNGAVTPVKNQGSCGCCWAFSAVASMEGINQITTGTLTSLSEQELLVCDTNGQHGCGGGWMDTAFEFVINNNGLASESDYPYTGNDQDTCDSSVSAAATIAGYEDVTPNSESALMNAVANQPVSVAIDGSGMDFQMYSGGVFTGECGTQLTHAVTVVGYGVAEDGTKYWLIKNSWGTTWGEDGYMRIQRDVDAEEGLCGLAMRPSYPTA